MYDDLTTNKTRSFIVSKSESYTTTLLVDQSPQDVFNAIVNPRGWWSEDILGETDRLNAVFYHQFKNVHRCTLQITELVPGKKIVWRVLQNYFDFISNTTEEWMGTDIVFEISAKKNRTEIRFTHVGLKPSEECYVVCHDAWGFYIRTSLRDLIASGQGEPNKKDTPSQNNPVQKPVKR